MANLEHMNKIFLKTKSLKLIYLVLSRRLKTHSIELISALETCTAMRVEKLAESDTMAPHTTLPERSREQGTDRGKSFLQRSDHLSWLIFPAAGGRRTV